MTKQKVGSASNREVMPYSLKSVEMKEGELVAIVELDSKDYEVALTKGVITYLLDAGFRTRLSAAQAGKEKKLRLDASKAVLENLTKGVFGRVSRKKEEAAEKRKAAAEKLRVELAGQGLPTETIEAVVETMLANMA